MKICSLSQHKTGYEMKPIHILTIKAKRTTMGTYFLVSPFPFTLTTQPVSPGTTNLVYACVCVRTTEIIYGT